jgi:hypothetical protein
MKPGDGGECETSLEGAADDDPDNAIVNVASAGERILHGYRTLSRPLGQLPRPPELA